MDKIGIILSKANTQEAKCQLLKEAEKGEVYEGMLVVVDRASPKARLLARIAEVVPYNDFFTDGDAWSESRRQGIDIPSDVARKWEICTLDLLRDLSSSRMSISFPPAPSDFVYKIDPSESKEEIFDVQEDQDGIIWLGALKGYQEVIRLPIDVEQLPMHLAVFGITGSGKSYTVGVLLERLLDIRFGTNRVVSYPMMIVDAHGDYVNYAESFWKEQEANPDERADWPGAASWFWRMVFPESSVKNSDSSDYVEKIGLDLDLLNPGDVANLIMEFYKGETSTSILQVSGLARVIDKLRVNGFFTNQMLMDGTLAESVDESGDIHHSSAAAINRALEHFVEIVERNHRLLSTDSELKDRAFVDKLTEKRGVAILDFSADGAPGVSLPTKQFVMTYLAKLLYSRFSLYKRKRKTRYLLFMIEEAQNFCPSSSYSVEATMSHSTLQAIATQGRKFGLSLCLISQRPSFLDRVVVSMCNSFVIHRVSPEDVGFVRKVTGGLPASLTSRLTNLGLGEAIVHGQMTTIPFPMLIRIPSNQRSVIHKAGTTEVVKGIAEASGIEE